MKYRDIIGYSKKQPKKKVVKEQKKPTIVDNIKQELNEWNDETFKSMPKRWSKPYGESLTEFEKQEMNEGPAYEYAGVFSKFEKAYMQLQKATDELGRFVTKKTGEKVDQKIIEKQWKKQVIPFYKLMKSWIRGKM